MPLVTRQQQQRAAEAATAKQNAFNRTKRRFQQALDDTGAVLVDAMTGQPAASPALAANPNPPAPNQPTGAEQGQGA